MKLFLSIFWICLISVLFTMGCGSKYHATKFLLAEVNSIVDKNPYVQQKDIKLHESLEFIADMHADTANWIYYQDKSNEQILGQCPERLCTDKTFERKANSSGHVDAVRLVEGNVALQVFALINGGSADQFNPGTFEIKLWNDVSGEKESRELPFKYYQRNPISPYFSDIEGITPYKRKYMLTPRPILQYILSVLGYPCEFWFSKNEDGTWPGAPYVRDWPIYAWDRLEYIDGIQSCPAADADPDRDIQLRWALKFSENLNAAAEDSMDEKIKLSIIKSKPDLVQFLHKRKNNKNMIAAMLSTEGLYMQNFSNSSDVDLRVTRLFNKLYNAGYRMMSFSHFMDSEFGGSSTGAGDLNIKAPYGPYDPAGQPWDKKSRGEKIGNSQAGTKLLDLMLEHGVIVDVAHASPDLISAIVDRVTETKTPIVCSHTGLKLFTDQNPRNLSKPQILQIASTNGVIGIGYWEKFVGGNQPIDFALAVRYTVDLIDSAQIHKFNDPDNQIVRGVDVVALGSDFDGAIDAIVDTAHLSAITRALTCSYDPVQSPDCLEDNFNRDELALIMGENIKRVMMELLPESNYDLPSRGWSSILSYSNRLSNFSPYKTNE